MGKTTVSEIVKTKLVCFPELKTHFQNEKGTEHLAKEIENTSLVAHI